MVWSRPNWRQGSGVDQLPITLLSQDGVAIVQVDSSLGTGRLVLLPGSSAQVLSGSMERRHTHSLLIRYTAGTGLDAWLDDARVATGVVVSLPVSGGAETLLLHSGKPQGGGAVLASRSGMLVGIAARHTSRGGASSRVTVGSGET